MLFITEGDSASGSITKARDVLTQAVFGQKRKPLNSFGLTKKMVYENEEFNLLQAAEHRGRPEKPPLQQRGHRYGCRCRCLHSIAVDNFFLQFFPDLVKRGHLYVLQTPLFGFETKKRRAIATAKPRSKRHCRPRRQSGSPASRLGEISPDEFRHFIRDDIRLDPWSLVRRAALPK